MIKCHQTTSDMDSVFANKSLYYQLIITAEFQSDTGQMLRTYNFPLHTTSRILFSEMAAEMQSSRRSSQPIGIDLQKTVHFDDTNDLTGTKETLTLQEKLILVSPGNFP